MQTLLSYWLTFILFFTSGFGLIGDKYQVFENIRYGKAERDLVKAPTTTKRTAAFSISTAAPGRAAKKRIWLPIAKSSQ